MNLPAIKGHPKATATLAGLVLVLAACAGTGTTPSPSSTTPTGSGATGLLATIQQRGYINIGATLNNAPESYEDPDTQKWVGIDADFAAALGEELGVEVRPQFLAAAAQIPAVTSGRIDAMIGLFKTAERQAVVDYNTVPYWYVGDMVITPSSDTSINELADLNGKTIAVQRGSAQEVEANAFVEQFGVSEIKLYPEAEPMLRDVAAGRVDSAIWWGFAFEWALKENPALGLRQAFTVPPGYLDQTELNGVYLTVPKGEDSTSLIAAIDALITKMKADGRSKAIFETYGLFDPSQITGQVE